MRTYDLTQMPVREVYPIMISAIVPRPIAFVSTQNHEGKTNLAPFSYFNGVSGAPAALMISVARNHKGEKKDTWRNIESMGEFVVNSANEWLMEPLNQTSAAYPYGVSEFEKVGLTPIPSEFVNPPRVKESAVQIECALHDIVEVGEGGAGSVGLIIGKMLRLHADEAVLDAKGRIDPVKFKPISRLGGMSYAKVGEIIDLPGAKVEDA